MAQPRNTGQLISLLDVVTDDVQKAIKTLSGVTDVWRDANPLGTPELISVAMIRAGVREDVAADAIGDLADQFRRIENFLVEAVDGLEGLTLGTESAVHLVEAIRDRVHRARETAGEFTV